MKNILIVLLMLTGAMFLQFCSASKSASATKKGADPSIVSYERDVAPIMQQRCTPCHFPDGGKVAFLDTYGSVKGSIDHIIARVEMDPAEEGFMPFESKKEPLGDSLVMVLKTWQSTGMSK